MTYLDPGLTPRAGLLPKKPEPSTAFGTDAEPGYLEAAARLSNTIVSGISYLGQEQHPADPNFTTDDLLGMLEGTRYEQGYLDNFIGVRSAAEARSVMSQIDREETYRDVLARSGFPGILASMAAGALDPTILVPLAGWAGVTAKAGRGTVIGVRAAEGAAVTAGIVAGQEGILQATQQTRTAAESAFSIGMATIIGGVLGAAVGSLGRSTVASLARRADAVPGNIAEEAALLDKAFGKPAPVGAALTAAERGSGELKGALGAEKVFGFQDPMIRLQRSPFESARNTVRDLAETPLTLAENAEGIPTTVGGSVETMATMARGPLAEGLETLDRQFSQYYFGRQVRLAALRGTVRSWLDRSADKMTYGQFKEAVFDALMSGDAHPVPEVQAAASALRRHVFDPLKERAILQRIFPEDVKPEGDVGYVPRLYNTEAIVARRPEFVRILSQWFDNTRPSAARVAELEDELAKLRAGKGSNAEISEAVSRLEAAIKHASLSRNEIDDIAEQITDTILGHSPERILTPKDIVLGPRGPLKERVLKIPTRLIRDFVERDVAVLSRIYSRTMAADLAMMEKFGSLDLAGEIAKINDDANRAIKAASTERARIALDKARKDAIRDLTGIRDRIRGTYGIPDNPHGIAVRAGRVVRNLNYLRLLGGMTVSSIPDIGRPVAVYGLTRVMRTAFHPLVRGLKGIRLAGREAQLAGTALDMTLDERVMSIADIMDNYGRGTRLERGVQALNTQFGLTTLMSPWNAFWKKFSGIIAQTRLLEGIDNLAAGKASANEIEYLAAAGIDRNIAGRIAPQFSKHGARDGAVWWANTGAWTDRQAVQAFRAAMVREVNRTIITPGQDRPLWMSKELGKVLGQFQSFNVASVQRTIIAGLQQRDAAALNGAVMMLGLGALSYYLKAQIAGYSVSDNPTKWAVEAFDNSGLAGWTMEANNIAEKFSRGRIGFSALTGEMAGRYASRNLAGSFLGPTADWIQGAGTATGSVFSALSPRKPEDRWKQSDTHAVRRMIPFQNLFYLRGLFDQAETNINRAFNVPVKRKKTLKIQ